MASYSVKAQPFLDVIAFNVFAHQHVRDWLISGTPAAYAFTGSTVLIDEQRLVRWHARPTKQPFWANYFCGLDSRCTCRIAGSKSLESDAVFFFRNQGGSTLAVHVEFKHAGEAFRYGQPEGYPLRAACFAKTYDERKAVNPHDAWTTVLFCGAETIEDPRLVYFDRVILHEQARAMMDQYPDLPSVRGGLALQLGSLR
ncbi:hypothetical protein [Devosia submarina]|uniref:hypothetical protein n=1 Tax=Devosia submarina TaxID=1173082 RepID=UPI00130018DD|nr:hypothetical protein [Devosia submarina]